MIFSIRTILQSVCVIFILFNVMDSASAVVGGLESLIQNNKYTLQLRENGDHFCGGTLIGERYVLTAAHCVEGMDIATLTVVGGLTDATVDCIKKKSSPQIDCDEQPVLRATMHSMYKPNSTYYDIAVIELKNKLKGNHIEIIEMCTEKTKDGSKIKIGGWGLTQEEPVKIDPDNLHTTTLTVKAANVCEATYKNDIKGIGFCAKDDHKGACTGDSGGPGVVNRKLCGVMTGTGTCGESMTVFIDVFSLKPFIDEHKPRDRPVQGSRRTNSPTRPTNSPTRPTNSPTRRTNSPTRRTNSPTRPTNSPTRRTNSPTAPPTKPKK